MLNFCCWKILIESWKKIITVVTIRYTFGRGWVSQYPHCGGKDTWHSVYWTAFALYICALCGICTVFPFHTERHTCIALHLHCSFEEISRVRSSHFAEASLSTPFRMACFYLLTPLRLPQVFLAVQNSSIGDLVTHWLTHSLTDWLTHWATFDYGITGISTILIAVFA